MQGRATWEEDVSADVFLYKPGDCSPWFGWQRSHFSVYPIAKKSLVLGQSLEEED